MLFEPVVLKTEWTDEIDIHKADTVSPSQRNFKATISKSHNFVDPISTPLSDIKIGDHIMAKDARGNLFTDDIGNEIFEVMSEPYIDNLLGPVLDVKPVEE